MKKVFKLAFFIIIAFIPMTILTLSMNQYRNEIRKEKVAELEIQLSRIIQNSNQVFSPFYPPIREIGVFKSSLEAVDSYKDQQESGKLEERFLNFLKVFSRNYTGAEICLQTEKKDSSSIHFFKNGKKTSSSRFLEITQKLHKHASPELTIEQRLKLRSEIYNILRYKYSCFINLYPLRYKDSSAIASFHIRDAKQRLKSYIIARHSKAYTLFIELCHPESPEKATLEKLVKDFNQKDFGLLFIPNTKFAGSKEKKQSIISSSFINKNSIKVRRIISLINQTPERFLTSSMDGLLFSALPYSAHKEYRIAVLTKLPKLEKRKDLELIIAFAGILAVFVIKVYSEHLVFGRIINLSLRSFLLLIFLAIAILPMVGAINLSNEYIVSRFKLEKNKTSEKLSHDLINLDKKNLENFEKLVILFRKFNSVEKLAKYVELPDSSDFKTLTYVFLNKLLKENNYPLVHQACVYELNKGFFSWEIFDNDQNYQKSEMDNPLFQEAFKPRFEEFLTRSGKSKKKTDKRIKFDKLKNELFDKLYLNLSGQESYFKLKENIGSVIKIDTFFDQNMLLSIPVSKNGVYKYVLTYILNSRHLRNLFPHNELNIKNEEPTFALFGTADFFKAHPGNINKISAKFPELTALAQKAHLAKAKVSSSISSASASYILLALPLKGCEYVLAGKRFTKSLESIQRELKHKTDIWVGLLVLALIIISLITTYYFAQPIKQLTLATKQIIAGNYSVRLDDSHSDEFGSISKVFNKMARGLEEGKLLSSYVSNSVENKISQNLDQSSKATIKKVTVVFSSILSFKELMTNLPADDLFFVLQSHLFEAENLAKSFHGDIDKMIEDKVMIVFEDHPGQESSSAERGFKLAVNLKTRFAEITGQDLAIGINTGNVVSAVMGAENVRLSETIVGDPVNLAARLASLAQTSAGSKIVISGQTKSGLKQKNCFSKLPINKVKGKTQEIEAFIYKA